MATRGTAHALEARGVACTAVNKVTEGRPHIVDMIKNKRIQLIVNTTEGKQAISDSFTIRREALNRKVCYTTTIAGARALVQAMGYGAQNKIYKLQDLHRENVQ